MDTLSKTASPLGVRAQDAGGGLDEGPGEQRRVDAKHRSAMAGVDGQSIERFAAKAELYLSELSAALRGGTYHPQAVKRVDIPKGDGRTRPLGIPTVKDRIIQTAVRLVIEPIFEVTFCEGSYGFRPGRGCHDASCRRRASRTTREVVSKTRFQHDRLITDGYTHVVDADLQSYFDTIPHDALMARVEEKVSDGRVLDLIRSWLTADILKDLERWTPRLGSPRRVEDARLRHDVR